MVVSRAMRCLQTQRCRPVAPGVWTAAGVVVGLIALGGCHHAAGLDHDATAASRSLAGYYVPGPGETRFTLGDGSVLTRTRSAPDDAGHWTVDDGTRTIELGPDEAGVLLYRVDAPGRKGLLRQTFDPPLVFMPETLEGGAFSSAGPVVTTEGGKAQTGQATREVVVLDDGTLVERLTIETGPAVVVRTVERPAGKAGVERRTLVVTVFGMRVRSVEETLTPE